MIDAIKAITMPDEAPEASELKLIMMTIGFLLDTHINLDVANKFIELDEQIVKKGGNKVGGFKNQCTFNIKLPDKEVNIKVFNNGKLVNVGCKKIEHAFQTAEILAKRFHNLKGTIRYDIPSRFPENKGVKKYFKDEIRKRWGDMIQTLICHMNMDIDLDMFADTQSADQAYKQFLKERESNPQLEKDLMYLLTIINIMRRYFPETEKETDFKMLDFFDNPDFQQLLAQIIDNTFTEIDENNPDKTSKGYIEMVFPCYLHEEIPIKLDNTRIKIDLINHGVNCNYYLDRLKLIELLKKCDKVSDEIVFDPEVYPGVISQHIKTKVKIIFFNTGKINITAAKRFEDVEEVYQFTKDFCRDNYHELVREKGYISKQNEYMDEMPNQFSLGQIHDKQYYLLKKSHILANPRNIYLLKKHGLLDCY